MPLDAPRLLGKQALAMGEMQAAAFYDMDGTLVSTNLVHSFLFVAKNEPSVPRSLVKSAVAMAKVPAFAAVDTFSRQKFNEMLFSGYGGAFKDRLLEFADEHFEQVLQPNIFPGAYELVQSAKDKGLKQVIISGSLDFMVAPLARHLGIDDMITNRLEFEDEVATGRLMKPIVAGAAKSRIIQQYAQANRIDLLESYGFSDSFSDYSMLSVVGRPAAVNPDRRLRRSAQELDWPILDLR